MKWQKRFQYHACFGRKDTKSVLVPLEETIPMCSWSTSRNSLW